MKINYSETYKNEISYFDCDTKYYILEINSKGFDDYWQECSSLDESFASPFDCKRPSNYSKILEEIKTNPNNEIAYPIISWVTSDAIKISQGRHRIRAIIDSGEDTIQLAIKEEYLVLFKKTMAQRGFGVSIVKEFFKESK